jgi:hypothetical protein
MIRDLRLAGNRRMSEERSGFAILTGLIFPITPNKRDEARCRRLGIFLLQRLQGGIGDGR